jgi:hypothetical protein
VSTGISKLGTTSAIRQAGVQRPQHGVLGRLIPGTGGAGSALSLSLAAKDGSDDAREPGIEMGKCLGVLAHVEIHLGS